MASDAAKTTAQGGEQFFDAAFQELNSGNRVQGLWAKCFAEADGDDAKARAAYIRVRATRLQSVYEAERVEKAEAETLAAIEVKIEEQEFGAPPKGGQKVTCPNCKALITLSALECPKCRASFRADKNWNPIPSLAKPNKSHRILWAMMLGTIGGFLSIFSLFVVMESSILRRNFQGDFLAEFYRTTKLLLGRFRSSKQNSSRMLTIADPNARGVL